MRCLWAQPPAAPETLTVAQAVERALRNYPSIQVSREQVGAAAAAIRLARTAYLPRIDALAMVNRATRNNLLGMSLPQSTIPSMSGPVLGTNNLGTAFGSAIGASGHLGTVRLWIAPGQPRGGSRGARPIRSRRQAYRVRGGRHHRGRLPHAGGFPGDGSRGPGRRGAVSDRSDHHRSLGRRAASPRRRSIAR